VLGLVLASSGCGRSLTADQRDKNAFAGCRTATCKFCFARTFTFILYTILELASQLGRTGFPTAGVSQNRTMAPEEPPKFAKLSKQDFDVISNRLAVALAKRESLIKSWTASSSLSKEPAKSQEELDAEDAAVFRSEPPRLGVGAQIPSHFLVSEAERNNKSLRAKFFPANGLKASKPRDVEEKLVSVKRGLRDESSDEEEGRSALGRAKKQKIRTRVEPIKDIMNEVSGGDSDERGRSGLGKVKKQTIESKPGSRSTAVAPKDGGSNLLDLIQPAKQVDQVGGRDGQTVMSNLEAHDASRLGGKTASGSVEDQKELKRIKKREKRKRQKLRAAGLLATP
jgi:hypothetical protein